MTTEFNKSAIMKRAWEIIRKADLARFGLRFILRNALRKAWQEAKDVIRSAKFRAYLDANPIDPELARLEAKDRWTREDYAEVHRRRVAA